ncbi:MAG: YceI family protein [Flavobacteriales bacterium]
MKLQLLSAAVAAMFLVSCGPSPEEQKAAREKAVADSLADLASMERGFMIDPSISKVNWTGVMLGVKEHKGTIGLSTGTFVVKGTGLVSGSFTADLTSLDAVQDGNMAPAGSPRGTKENLVGHLKSPDFFDVATYPTATFVITNVEGATAKGNLTVRGKTNEETVTDIVVVEEAGTVKATGTLTFDRQKYGLGPAAGAKDMVLSDNIELKVELVGKSAM